MPLHFPYNKNHKERARELRNHMTPEERAVWQLVRRKRIHGVTFYRQKPIDQYIVDFYCPKAKLVVEVDGDYHLDQDHRAADRLRDESLAALGLEILRVSNLDVRKDLRQVEKRIVQVVGRRLSL